jgi:hypothetical protein
VGGGGEGEREGEGSCEEAAEIRFRICKSGVVASAEKRRGARVRSREGPVVDLVACVRRHLASASLSATGISGTESEREWDEVGPVRGPPHLSGIDSCHLFSSMTSLQHFENHLLVLFQLFSKGLCHQRAAEV